MDTRVFGLILALTISAYATEPEGRFGEIYTDSLGRLCRQIGDYVQYANPDPFIEEPTDGSPNWPITTNWWAAAYINDTTIASYVDPRIGVGDSIIHVFGNGRVHPHHYVSMDDGASWGFMGDYFDTTSNIGVGSINVFGEENRIATSWGARYGNNRGVVYFRSSADNGQTWPVIAQLRVQYGPNSDARYGNIAGSGDTLLLSFKQHDLGFSRSTNFGTFWTQPRIIAELGATYPPSIAYGAGVVGITYNQFYNGTIDVYYISSFDQGDNWNDPVFLGFPDGMHGQWPEMAADSMGNIAVCWMDYIGTNHGWNGGIWCRVSHDSGQTWEQSVRLDTDYWGSVGTSVVIDGDYVGVCWASDGPNHRLSYRESWDGGLTFRGEEVISDQGRDPRLIKKGEVIHLTWTRIEEIGPDRYWHYMMYMRKDQLTRINDDGGQTIPTDFRLYSYPNPFNSNTVITLEGSEGGDRVLEIFDITGALLRTLNLKEGKTSWDARDNLGRRVSSGLYFARVETPQGSIQKKLIFLK